jgi:peptide chain release factor 1
MEEKLASIEARYNELSIQMGSPDVANDYTRYAELARQQNEMQPVVAAYREWQRAKKELAEAQTMADGEDSDLAEMARAELAPVQTKIEELEKQLKGLLVPKDPHDDRDVIVEIRAGAGGDEAGLFAADLYRMYTRYSEEHHWKVEEVYENETGIGGYKEVTFNVRGKGAYSRLKFESGVHRVQRVPSTESSGRIHTSTATVAVLPQVDDVEINIPDKDIEVEVYKSQGAGGQNVQKNATAVRLRHIPSGIVVQCQDERSQLQNRIRAMGILRSRLYALEHEKQEAAITESRRDQVGTGERSEKIRTYNFPQNRVTDHRLDKSLYKLEAVLNGDLDEFSDELGAREQARKLETAGV